MVGFSVMRPTPTRTFFLAIVAVAALGKPGGRALALPCCQGCSPAVASSQSFYLSRNAQLQEKLLRVYQRRTSLRQRIEAVSQLFLSTPYKRSPLGEGAEGVFDRDPLIRFDAFDCTTFVETVLALSLESDLDSGMRILQKIRYKDGKIDYLTRNHFTELDWVPNNIKAGFLRDITTEIAGQDAVEVSKTISKRQWYLRKSIASFHGRFSEDEKHCLLPALRALGEQFPDQRATLPVLPIQDLPRIIERIPSGAIVNLVRADQAGRTTIVSHQALLIKKNDKWYVRHASSIGRAVEDDPVFYDLSQYRDSRWPLIGLNLNLPQDPNSPIR
jgi:hypothetical protein